MEYGLIVALMALALIVVLTSSGQNMASLFQLLSDRFLAITT